jgi:hypothetical protein
MIIHIKGNEITMPYNESLDLSGLGTISIQRASYVEPGEDGKWTAAMVGGPVLGPFNKRSEALKAEVQWLEENLANIQGKDKTHDRR